MLRDYTRKPEITAVSIVTVVSTNDAILLFTAAKLTSLLSFRSVFNTSGEFCIMYANAARVYHQGKDKLHKTGCPQSVPQPILPVLHPSPNTEWMIHINPMSVLPNPLTRVPAPSSTAYMEILLVDEESLKQPTSCSTSLFSFLKSLFTMC